MDGHAAMMGDWAPPSPSPGGFFSSFLGGDEQVSLGPMPRISAEDKNESPYFGVHQGMSFEYNVTKQGDNSFDNDMILTPLPDHKSSSRGGLADRIAARAGFSAPRLNTESIKMTDQLSTDGVKFPYLTIPPGISPTALLESPVFISNSQTQASPTTGRFPLFTVGNGKGFTTTTSKEDFMDDVNDSASFAFKPHTEPILPFSLGIANRMSQAMNPQVLANIEVSVKSDNSFCNSEPSKVHSHECLYEFSTDKEHGEIKVGSDLRSLDTISVTTEHSPPLSDQQNDEGDQMIGGDSVAGGSAGGVHSEDGYNWRKYGQKQVKGSEYPRSYYKCTHINCPVKKKVERSVEGHITGIIYRGVHNHSDPALNWRTSMGSNQLDDSFAHNQMTPTLQNGALVESGDAVDPSSTTSGNGEEGDPGTHGSVSVTNDVEGDESESKRRKLETYAAEVGSGATRAIREPRVVVQTTSDVDILDDGYRWRKYGQKVVKGNPNPRSYYKCTSIGCSVRKHVERASNDLNSVITTYEGKHNHDVPVARNSSHVSSYASAAFASQGANLVGMPESAQVTGMARYVRPPHVSSFNMPMMQTHGFSFGMNQSSMSMSGLGAGIPAHPYVMQQQQQQQQCIANDMSFVMPKGEVEVEPNSTQSLYLSNGSSVYHQIMKPQEP